MQWKTELGGKAGMRVSEQAIAPSRLRERVEHAAHRSLRALLRRKRQRGDVQDGTRHFSPKVRPGDLGGLAALGDVEPAGRGIRPGVV
jgi:hypothetical protein